jgi:hypothetical protein
MDPDQPVHPRRLIRIQAVRLPTLLQVEKLIANRMDPDQTADAQAGLDPCWSQTHYVGFVVTRIYNVVNVNLFDLLQNDIIMYQSLGICL